MRVAAASAICGTRHVLPGEGLAGEYGRSRAGTPLLVARPAAVEEVQGLVRLAAGERVPVVAWGAGTRQDWGPPLTGMRPTLFIDLRRLTHPRAVNADNLTATVGAGMSLADLDALLAPAGLCWPVERLDGVTPTVGGTVATAASGPSRRAIGPTARWVLGAEAVTADGEVVHAGGQTVKNVAGYDLTRLLVGSWGALGILTAVTLRLAARPAVTRSLLLTFAGPSAGAGAAIALADHPLGAAAVELLDADSFTGLMPASPPSGHVEQEPGSEEATWALLVRAEGHEEQVAGLERAACRIAIEHDGVSRFLDEEAAALVWRARADAWRPGEASLVGGTWTIPPVGVAAALAALPQVLPARGLVARSISGHAGDGVLHIALQPRESNDSETHARSAARCIAALRSAGVALRGSWRTEIAPNYVWSRAGADPPAARQRLFDHLRIAADPEGFFATMKR